MSLSFTTIDGEIGEKLDKIFKVRSSFLKVQPGDCLLPPQYVFIATKIRDLEIRNDDVWIVSYPRTGEFDYKFYRLINKGGKKLYLFFLNLKFQMIRNN